MSRRIILAVASLLASACRAPANANAPNSYRIHAIQMTRIGAWMGTPHPLLVQGGSDRFSWLVACQARRDTDSDGRIQVLIGQHGETLGDQLSPYFMVAEGPGERIDRYIGSSRSGRFVAFEQYSQVFVFDALTKTRSEVTQLGASSRKDDNPTLSDPSVAFSPGHRLAFVRKRPGRYEVVLVDLETNALSTRKDVKQIPAPFGG